MKISNIVYAAVIGLAVACNQSDKPAASAQDSLSEKKVSAVKIKDGDTQSIYADYIQLKDALVSSDPVKAKSASKSLASSLKQVEGCEATSKIADSISLSTDLKDQRQHFVSLSAEIIPLIKGASLTSGNVFVQHCPMADNGKGALWLASEKEIRNPYYGDEMMECGDVQEEIKVK